VIFPDNLERRNSMATAPTTTRAHTAALAEDTSGRTASRVNVGEVERWASLLGGGALTAFGLARGTLGGLGLALAGGALVYRGLSGHCPMYGALGLSTAGPRGPATSVPAGHGVKIDRTFTIQRSPQELYNFWRRFENLPRFMSHLKEVRSTGNRSHWVACGPLGTSVEWDAEVITERSPEVIGWRSLEGSEIDCAGSVHFTPAPGGRGTEVRVVLKYDPPAGKLGAAIAGLFGEDAEQQITEDLHRFTQMMEAGEGSAAERQPSGRTP
jgi:uncharacterized membrane protein